MGRFILLLSLLFSCSHFVPSKRVTIRTEVFDPSKDQAMFQAYQKALVLITESGCDPDLGRGNAIYKRVGSGYIAEATYIVEEKYCTKVNTCDVDWAKQDTRSQAGEWIWFLGKAVSHKLAEADLRARGQALDYLVQECALPHKSTRFIERCEQRNGSSYTVYTRASIKHQECIEAQNASPASRGLISSQELDSVLALYRQSR